MLVSTMDKKITLCYNFSSENSPIFSRCSVNCIPNKKYLLFVGKDSLSADCLFSFILKGIFIKWQIYIIIGIMIEKLWIAYGVQCMNKNIHLKINREAVFSDETTFFRVPLNPKESDEIKIRLRVLKDDIDYAEMLSAHGKVIMYLEFSQGVFDYYAAKVLPSDKDMEYCFRINKNDETLYYSKIGFSDYHIRDADFLIIKDFEPPSWCNGAVMYQIYVDRFYNGDLKNNVKTGEYIYLGKPVRRIENWYKCPDWDDVRDFYGGDLLGVIEKLEYLKNLGVEAIYLNPIFVSPSNHKYDTQDYEHVDPHLGKIVVEEGELLEKGETTNENASLYVTRTTNEENLKASDDMFADLVEKAHKAGIKVIVDGVFNHCGAFNKWLDGENIYGRTGNYAKGAFNSEDSPYHDYFVWNEDGDYEGWWDYPNHPKLHYENSKELLDNILNVSKKWVSPPFNADGWRVDVAADLGLSKQYNHYFWREFRKTVKGANPEAVILAEHYGNPVSWLEGDQWDTIMNYDAFMEPLSYFLTGMEKHSDRFDGKLLNNGKYFANCMIQNMSKLPIQALMSSMNQISNHDHSRFLTRTNHACGRVKDLGTKAAEINTDMAVMREAVMVQMTWIGAPTIYYGDEAGLCGFTDPDNRRTFPWGKEEIGLIQYHQQLIRLRKQNPVLRYGSTLFLVEEYGVIAYGRFDKENKIVVALNNSDEQKEFCVPVWRIGITNDEKMVRLYKTYNEGFGFSGKSYDVINGCIRLAMPKKSGVIILNEKQYFI